MTQTSFFFNNQPFASASGVKPKRKRATSLEPEDGAVKQFRVRSPQLDRRQTFPLHADPDFMGEHSASSGSEGVGADLDMPVDMDVDMGMNGDVNMANAMGSSIGAASNGYLAAATPVSARSLPSYSCEGGSGGFGFGPGAEEDMDSDGDDAAAMALALHQRPLSLSHYPSLVAHPNPNHFSNREPSAWSAQPFATTLSAPGQPGIAPGSAGAFAGGLIQPAAAGPLPPTANAVERARSQHGPHCTSIPRLQLSDYPDPTTGQRSMWTTCPDCGACERAS